MDEYTKPRFKHPAQDFRYEVGYEWDGYDYYYTIYAFNLHGHGYTPDEIEWFLDYVREEGELPEDDIGGWEVREDWLRKVPHPEAGSMHVYGKPGRGAKAVTVLDRPRFWGYWCYKHPHEPATTGVPANTIIDGESIVERRIKELEEEEDPRVNVSNSHSSCYIYYCRECADSYYERFEKARRAAMAEYYEKQAKENNDGN